MDIIALVFNVLALCFAYRQLSFFSEMFMDLLSLLAPGKRLGRLSLELPLHVGSTTHMQPLHVGAGRLRF